jgi:transposase
LLLWERNGFILWYKRLERDKFHWPRDLEQTVLTLSIEQLNWLLDGYDVWRMKPHQSLHFSVFS